MRPLKAFLGSHLSAASSLLSIGPAAVLLAWFVAGQWDSAGPEPRAWLQFTGVLCLASLTPLPGRSFSLADFRRYVNWWGWVVVVGLLVTL